MVQFSVGMWAQSGYTVIQLRKWWDRSLALLFPLERQDEFTQILEQLKRGEHIHHYETERVHKDGSRLYISLSISPIRDGAGVVVAASTIVNDVNARKRAEAELLALKDRLTTDLAAMTHLHELGAHLLATVAQPLLQDALADQHRLTGRRLRQHSTLQPTNWRLEIIVQQGFDHAFLTISAVSMTNMPPTATLRNRASAPSSRMWRSIPPSSVLAIAAATGFRFPPTPLFDCRATYSGMFSTHFRHPHQFTEHELRLTYTPDKSPR